MSELNRSRPRQSHGASGPCSYGSVKAVVRPQDLEVRCGRASASGQLGPNESMGDAPKVRRHVERIARLEHWPDRAGRATAEVRCARPELVGRLRSLTCGARASGSAASRRRSSRSKLRVRDGGRALSRSFYPRGGSRVGERCGVVQRIQEKAGRASRRRSRRVATGRSRILLSKHAAVRSAAPLSRETPSCCCTPRRAARPARPAVALQSWTSSSGLCRAGRTVCHTTNGGGRAACDACLWTTAPVASGAQQLPMRPNTPQAVFHACIPPPERFEPRNVPTTRSWRRRYSEALDELTPRVLFPRAQRRSCPPARRHQGRARNSRWNTSRTSLRGHCDCCQPESSPGHQWRRQCGTCMRNRSGPTKVFRHEAHRQHRRQPAVHVLRSEREVSGVAAAVLRTDTWRVLRQACPLHAAWSAGRSRHQSRPRYLWRSLAAIDHW
jgi:hypothetical protein